MYERRHEKPSCSSSCVDKFRTRFVPVGGLFVCVCERNDRGFRKRRSADLKADWKAGRSKPTRHGYRGQPIDVESSRIIQSAAGASSPGRRRDSKACIGAG
jgi:hypothetical protein